MISVCMCTPVVLSGFKKKKLVWKGLPIDVVPVLRCNFLSCTGFRGGYKALRDVGT